MLVRKVRPGHGATEALAARLTRMLEAQGITGYTLVKNSELTLPGTSSVFPVDLAIFPPGDGPAPHFIAHVDPQACGAQNDYSGWIHSFAASGVPEFWIIYPRDKIIVQRKLSGEQFGKPAIFSEEDRIPLPLSAEDSIQGRELFYGA